MSIMRKLILCSLLFICNLAWSQFTTVTGTIVSSDGFVFANGIVTATFIPIGGQISCTGYILQGVGPMGGPSTPCSAQTVMDTNGSFTLLLADNSLIQANGTTWNIGVCPPISVPCQYFNTFIAGPSIDLSTTITNNLAPLQGAGLVLPIFFSDSEVSNTNNISNVLYFNTSLDQVRIWNGIGWASTATGASNNLPSNFYSPQSGQFNFPQLTNGNKTIFGNRATDTSCSGPWQDFRNAANTIDLFLVDCNGVVQTPEIFISGPTPQIAIPITNSGTGTGAALLAKTINGQIQTITTSDTAIPAYPVIPSNTVNGSVVCAPGTSGSACPVLLGITTCTFDGGGSTVDHYVGASTTVAGNCKDVGATLPAGPLCIVGRAMQSVSGGQNATVLVQPFCYHT